MMPWYTGVMSQQGLHNIRGTPHQARRYFDPLGDWKESPVDRKQIGATGEKLAASYLKKHGYKLVERNYHCREGEIDIVARQKGALVFVEVRTKTGTAFGTPEESVTRAKKTKMAAAAFRYLREHGGTDGDWRIDLVAVELDLRGKVKRIEVIENAVGG